MRRHPNQSCQPPRHQSQHTPQKTQTIRPRRRERIDEESRTVSLPSPMLPGTLLICSAIGYALALALEFLGLRQRFAWRPIALRGATLCAVIAHTIYLIRNATSN